MAASLFHVASAAVAFQQHISSIYSKQTPVAPGGKVKKKKYSSPPLRQRILPWKDLHNTRLLKQDILKLFAELSLTLCSLKL